MRVGKRDKLHTSRRDGVVSGKIAAADQGERKALIAVAEVITGGKNIAATRSAGRLSRSCCRSGLRSAWSPADCCRLRSVAMLGEGQGLRASRFAMIGLSPPAFTTVGEASAALNVALRGNVTGAGEASVLALPFIGEEEESLVFDDRAAQ